MYQVLIKDFEYKNPDHYIQVRIMNLTKDSRMRDLGAKEINRLI